MYENLKGKSLLFLGAIKSLCEPIQMAKDMGIYTIATDYLPDSPAKKVADKAYMVSTTDVDAVCQLCRDEHIDGLFTGYMDGMLTYAREICDRMGWPFYASYDQIRLSHDKSFFREQCIKYGVPCPVDYTDEVMRKGTDVADVKFPLIIKPVDMYGGRGITIARDREELKRAFDYAMSFSPSKRIIVEEYMVGVEVTATYTMKNGEISLSRLGDKYISEDHEDCQSQGDILFMPSRYLKDYINTTNIAIKKLLKGLKATDGTCFFQGIANSEKIALFECGYRPNGSADYRHISHENGINYIQMMIAHALTGEMAGYELSQDNPFFKETVVTYNLWAHPGIIGKMSGVDQVQKLSNVVKAEFKHEIGDEITERMPYQQAVFRAVIADTDINRIKNTILSVQQLVRVEDEAGNNMLYKPFNIERLG